MLNRNDLSKELAVNSNMSKNAIVSILKDLENIIKKRVKKGEIIKLGSLGKFKKVKRAARKGINPQNPKEKIKIPARNVIIFKPSITTKNFIKGKK